MEVSGRYRLLRRRFMIADRWAVVSRALAAVLGGYCLTNAVAVFFTAVLPVPRADAVLAMTLASFALYAVTVVWAFAARTATLAWLGIVVPTAMLGGAFLLLGPAA